MNPSLLPPRTRNKILRLFGQERKIYVQELIGVYGSKVDAYRLALRHFSDPYIENQKVHFEGLLTELETLMAESD